MSVWTFGIFRYYLIVSRSRCCSIRRQAEVSHMKPIFIYEVNVPSRQLNPGVLTASLENKLRSVNLGKGLSWRQEFISEDVLHACMSLVHACHACLHSKKNMFWSGNFGLSMWCALSMQNVTVFTRARCATMPAHELRHPGSLHVVCPLDVFLIALVAHKNPPVGSCDWQPSFGSSGRDRIPKWINFLPSPQR